MGENKNFAAFLAMDLIFLVVFIGLISLIFELTRIAFIAEVVLFLIILLIVVVTLIGVYNNLRWGFVLSSMLFAVILIDLLLIYFRNPVIGITFFITTVMSAIGFIIAVVNIKEEEAEEEPAPAEEAEETESKAKFTPGKYVSSKRASYYHSPKCDWAKKINKSNAVWLESEEEAANKGLKKHSCLE